MKKGENGRGFTIIEASLVIAIAGLIFLMVFIALPGLRTSQRDTQRRADVTHLIEEIKNYQTNNRGALPSHDFGITGEYVRWLSYWDTTGLGRNDDGWEELYYSYLGKDFVDPNGNAYTLHVVACNMDGSKVMASTPDVECPTTATGGMANVSEKSFPNSYNMSVVIGATCYGDQAVGSSNQRKVAVLYKLEGAGTYCENS